MAPPVRRTLLLILLLSQAALGPSANPLPTSTSPTTTPRCRPEVRERVLASIVGIRTQLPAPRIKFTGKRKVSAEVTPSEGTGSGIVVDASGVVLTCAHVVGDAGMVRIFLPDDREVPGRVTVLDRTSDLALVKVDGGPFPALDLTASARAEKGAYVFLVSRPGGAAMRFLEGTLAVPGSFHLGHSQFEFFRQFAGSIEPGDSGGVVIDGEGRLVGVVSVGLPEGNLGYAMAREFVLVALTRLLAGPPVVWPWLGVAVESPPEPPGAIVWTVLAGSPAEVAGLRRGDRIVSIDGKTVDHFLPAMLTVISRPIGSRFVLGLIRGGARAANGEDPVPVVSAPRPLDPALAPLDLFERQTGIRLEAVVASADHPASLRVASFRLPKEGSPKSYGVGSQLVGVVPGLGLVRALEEGRADQELKTRTVHDLGQALRESFVGDRVALALIWETEGRKTTMFLSGEAQRYPIL